MGRWEVWRTRVMLYTITNLKFPDFLHLRRFNDRPTKCWERIDPFHWWRDLFARALRTQIWVVKVYNARNSGDVGAVPSRTTVCTIRYGRDSFKAQESILLNSDISPSISWIVSRRLVFLADIHNSRDDFPLGTRAPRHFCPDIAQL